MLQQAIEFAQSLDSTASFLNEYCGHFAFSVKGGKIIVVQWSPIKQQYISCQKLSMNMKRALGIIK